MMSYMFPLLTKPLNEWLAEEFKRYVESLKQEKKSRGPTIRLKKPKPEVVWKITPKGSLSVRINRTPKEITREELRRIAEESGFPENLVWTTVLHPKRKVKEPVRLRSDEEKK